MPNPIPGIYLLEGIGTGACYVGETTDLARRREQHKKDAAKIRALSGTGGKIRFRVLVRLPDGTSKKARRRMETHWGRHFAQFRRVVSSFSRARPLTKAEEKRRQLALALDELQ